MQFEKLGPYELESPLGKGGMGAVYAAKHVETGQRVALKVLSPQLAMAEGFRDRFEAEIESLKILKHPGIVRLIGYGEEEGYLFYAMELVEGTSLEQELNAGRRFDWRETAEIGVQVCRALKHAHDHGIVHRDIKPANLLMNAEGDIKIADFGIARLFGGTQLTTAGGVLGTADYMSPEQAAGQPVTEKCDQYSLGGVLYALLAGRPPFRANSLPEMLQLQRYAEPEPVRRFAFDTPEQLDKVLLQLLAKDPNERFPNVIVLAKHLGAMIKALSRPVAEEEDFELEVEPPVERTDPQQTLDATRLQAGPDANAETRQATFVPPASGNTDATQLPEESGISLELTPGTNQGPTRGATHGASIFEQEAPGRTTHFTTVDEEAVRAAQLRSQDRTDWRAVAAIFGALALLAGAVIYYITSTKSADELYASISTTAQKNIEGLRFELSNIETFMENYPEDERFPQVAAWLDAYREESRRARETAVAEKEEQGQQALQIFYDIALRHGRDDPREGVLRMKALLALFDSPAEANNSQDVDDATIQTLRRARAYIEMQQRNIATREEKLAAHLANELAQLDGQADADATVASLRLLYKDHPWALERIDAWEATRPD